jgi:transcriptional regulator with XRE-family HTH domain
MNKKEKMKLLREQGFKHQEIADMFGVSRQYVADVCGNCDPAYFIPIGDECVYPNLKKWMNENKVSRREFIKRMGLTPHTSNHARFNKCVRGEYQPPKPYIDKMLAVTGLTYEKLFEEVQDG